MTARQATIRRARLRAIAVAGLATAAWFMDAMAAQALPGGDPPGIQGARDRVGAVDLIITPLGPPPEFPDAVGVRRAVSGAGAVLTSVLAPAVAALPVGMHQGVRRLARLSFPL